MKSLEILPKEERCNWDKEPLITEPNYLINIMIWKYHKALEAAEGESTHWKRKFEELNLDYCSLIVELKETLLNLHKLKL